MPKRENAFVLRIKETLSQRCRHSNMALLRDQRTPSPAYTKFFRLKLSTEQLLGTSSLYCPSEALSTLNHLVLGIGPSVLQP
jgi:hypothetical protein